MKKKSKYTESGALASLRKKGVVPGKKKRLILKDSSREIGSGSWGKLDFLTGIGYTVVDKRSGQ
jgi:hypothetical protein